MTLEKLLAGLLENSPVIGSTLLIVWLSLPQLAERFEFIAKALRPFSKKWRAQTVAADKAAQEKAELDRQKLLAEAQSIAQTTATTATTAALVVVQKQCRDCIDELHGLRDITGRLIDAVESLMVADTPATRADTRAVIRLARAAM